MSGVAAEAGQSAWERSERAAGREVIDHLREQIRRVQAAPRRYLVTLSSGSSALDALGVFRLGGAVELSGEEASGRTTLALSLVAAACREKRLSAWVDGPRELYPPAAVPMGVDLKRLLIVRPPAPGQLVWSTVQLLRSGAFTCVVLDVTHTGLKLTMIDTKKLLDAARAGGSLLVVLTSNVAPAQGLVRLVMAERAASVNGVRHLRVIGEPVPVEEEPQLQVEVARAHGSTGKQLVVPRRQLATIARSRRSHVSLHPGLEVPRITSQSSLQRPKKNELRDGRGFSVATRPGRDGALSLSSVDLSVDSQAGSVPKSGHDWMSGERGARSNQLSGVVGELPLHACAPPGNRRRPAAKLSQRDSIATPGPSSGDVSVDSRAGLVPKLTHDWASGERGARSNQPSGGVEVKVRSFR